MDKILEIYNEYHFLVLIFVIIFFVIYINSIQKKENITILQNEVTKTNATVEQKENIKVDINEAENENLKDLSNEIVDTKIDIESNVKIKYLLTNEELLIQIVNKSSINQRVNDGIKYVNSNSPLALALMNKTIGDIVKFRIENYNENYLYVEVLDIPNALEEKMNLIKEKTINNNRIMTPPAIINNYIEKMRRENPLNSIDKLIYVLKEWKDKSDSETVGDLSVHTKNTPILWIKINEQLYYINADTKRKGIVKFLQNHENNNQLIIIMNSVGKYNKVTNDSNDKPIPGLYFYAENARNGIEII
jgi:transcription elongation GreA/GreB family factor